MAIIQHPLAPSLPNSDCALKSLVGPQLPAKPYYPLLTSLLCPEKQIWYSKRRWGKSCREDRGKQRVEEEKSSSDYVKTCSERRGARWKEWLWMKWQEEEGEKLPSKNSEFM